MNAIRGGGLYLNGATGAELADLAARYALANPDHEQWSRARARNPDRVGKEPPRYITALRKIPGGPWEGRPWLPRACRLELDHHTDATTCPAAARLVVRPHVAASVRPFQADVVDGVLTHLQGQAVVACGGGKSFAGILTMAALPTPSMVLVNSRALMHQWCDDIREKLVDADVGQFGDGRRDWGSRIVVALVQSLAQLPWWDLYQWGRRFGLVVTDECHHTPANTVTDLLAALPARYRLGLTATPDRADGLGPILDWSFGRRLVELGPSDLEALGYTVPPRIRWVRTEWEMPRDATAAAKGVTNAGNRNALIVRLAAERIRAGRRVLVLLDQVDHVVSTTTAIRLQGCGAETLVGELNATKRRERLAAFRSGALPCLVATQVADEALDLPELDTVLMGVPGRNHTRVQQRVGRAVRVSPGKPEPEILDLVDRGMVARSQALARAEIYDRCGWAAEPPPVDEPQRRGSAYDDQYNYANDGEL